MKIIGIISALGAMEIIFLLFGAVSFSRTSYFKDHFENFSAQKIELVIILFLAMLASYSVLWICREGFERMQKRVLIGSGIVFVATCVVIPPFLSRDIAAYLSETTTPYGPLFHGAMVPIVFFAQNKKLSDAQDAYKIINALLFIVSICIVVRLTRLLSLPSATPYLYAYNPAILIQGVLEGHNDIWLILCILLFLYAWIRKKYVHGSMFLMGSIAIKYISVILMPILFIKNKKFTRNAYIVFLLFIAGMGYIAVSLLGFSFMNAFQRLFSQFLSPCLYACTPIISMIRSFFGKTSHGI